MRKASEPIRRYQTQYVVQLNIVATLSNFFSPQQSKIAVLSEHDVWVEHGDSIRAALAPASVALHLLNGELSKNLAEVEAAIEFLSSEGVHRREAILIAGGGAVCDVGGLVSMLYFRGIDYVLLPTSLIAQVDASVGGKVGCNFQTRKNLVGGFHYASSVLIDPLLLRSLPTRHLRAGFAEVVKLAMIDPDLDFDLLLEPAAQLQLEALELLIQTAVASKLSIIESDPFEFDLDRSLNLGHAVAHALEGRPQNELMHGEAVGVGLCATARFSARLGICGEDNLKWITTTVSALGLPTEVDVDEVDLAQRLSLIREHRGGRMRLVVPDTRGGVRIIEDCDVEVLANCVVPS